MKNYYFVIALLVSVLCNAQCDIKINNRPDGNTIKYFNPKPIAKLKDYEIGVALYNNVSTGKMMLNVSVLFKGMIPTDIEGDLTAQVAMHNGLVLKFINSHQLEMNGNNVTIALFEMNGNQEWMLGNSYLKSLYFHMNGKLYGSTVTENKDILIKELKCIVN